jgi:hypothetical protein
MKPEYHEGREALERFGKTMNVLFRVPKTVVEKESKKPIRKAKKSSKG